MIETIPSALAGQRVDRVVAMLIGCTRSVAADLVSDGAVKVDTTVVSQRSIKLAEGSVIEIEEPPVVDLTPEPEVSVQFDVVHEDDEVIVVNKPAGLVTHPGAGNTSGTLVNGLLARFPEIAGVGELERPGIVHRLDKDTSGLLMVARTERAYTHLVKQLAERTAHRAYFALVRGRFESLQGVIDANIGRSRRDPTRMTVTAGGRSARTRYRVQQVWTDPEVSMVECLLDTGRTHQIRVHLRAIEHPIIGDPRYGSPVTGIDLDRPWLHATRLGFVHPATRAELEFSSPLPPELQRVLDDLGPDESLSSPAS